MSLDFSLGVGDGASSSSARIDRRRSSPLEGAEEVGSSTSRHVAAVRFVDADARERACRDAAQSRSIVLRPRADYPGGLASMIDGDLESALALRGAHPSSLGETASLETRLHDQLTRASCVPVRGVCLALPPLGACVEMDGVLADVDARYLSAWLVAAASRPVPISILFDAQDRLLRARVPRSLDEVVAELRGDASVRDRAIESHVATIVTTSTTRQISLFSDIESDGLSFETQQEQAPIERDSGMSIPDLLEMTASDTDPPSSDGNPDPARDATAPQVASAPSKDVGPEIEVATEIARRAEVEAPAPPSEKPESALYRAKPPPVFGRVRNREARDAASSTPEARPAEAHTAPARPKPASKSLATVMSETLRPPSFVAENPVVEAPVDSHADEQRVLNGAQWRAHAVELDGARGPKPVSAIERLFAQRYLPLVGALARGEADHAVGSIVEQWSQAFAESYTDSFSALKVTGRRPTMVLDAFDVASRIARLSSARSVKLLLVDSLGFELAERVATRMKTALDKRAVLVERTTLWSALPTTTPTQMALLARGPDGLRESAPASSSEPDVARGRNIASLRRERVGSRELIKLDLVEARLRSPGAAYDERLDAIADEVTDIVVKFMETLPPRTLLYVFGDHGFVLGHGANGWATGPATQGGASPEEVLVAGHAWLVDAMQ